MLREVSDLQESDESVWGEPEISFTIQTKGDKNGKIRRKYTFSRAPEWDEWMFTEFEETRGERRSRKVAWNDSEARTVDVPPEVTDRLKELLDLDELNLKLP